MKGNLILTLGFTIFSVLPIAPLTVHAEEPGQTQKPTLLHFVGPETKPTLYLGHNGQPQGPLLDYIRTLTKHAGYRLTTKLTDVDQTAGLLIRGQADFTVMVKHPKLDLSDAMASSPTPVGHLVLNIYRQPDTPPLTRAFELKHKKVVVLKGYSYGGILQSLLDTDDPPTFYEVSTPDKALHMLKSQRAQYALLYVSNFKYGLPKTNYKASEFASNTISTIPFYIHASKHGAINAEKLLSDLMTSYNDLVASKQIAPLQM